MDIWTLYARPIDYPDDYVARRFTVSSTKGLAPTSTVLISKDLAALRDMLIGHGLTPIARHHTDPVHVIESWL